MISRHWRCFGQSSADCEQVWHATRRLRHPQGMRWGVARVLGNSPEFFKLWFAQCVSAAGSAITVVALPLVAVIGLGASPFEMGLLSAMAVAPHLVLGIPAGSWVDRWSRRRVMIVADLGRAALLGSIPVLAAIGELRIEHLYVVAVLTGILTMLSDTASLALLPSLVRREDLMEANSAAMLNQTMASTVGPSMAGGLVQLVSAPFAIVADAVSYLIAAASSFLIKEPVRQADVDGSSSRPRAGIDMTSGLRQLFGHPILRALTCSATVAAIAGAMQGPLVVLYMIRELHWAPILVGVAITLLGVASVFGTLAAPAFGRRLGIGRAYVAGQLIGSLAGFFLALAAWPLVFVGQLLTGLGFPLYSVPQRALRQALVPEHLLGRTTAAWRTLVIGGQTVGSLLGGVVATLTSTRSALVISSLGMLLGMGLAFFSPLRSLRKIPSGQPAAAE